MSNNCFLKMLIFIHKVEQNKRLRKTREILKGLILKYNYYILRKLFCYLNVIRLDPVANVMKVYCRYIGIPGHTWWVGDASLVLDEVDECVYGAIHCDEEMSEWCQIFWKFWIWIWDASHFIINFVYHVSVSVYKNC